MITDIISVLKHNVLFCRMTESEIKDAAASLLAVEKHFKKGDYILHAGDTTHRMGIVLSGSVTVESNDVWGNHTILYHVGADDSFAGDYALLPSQVLLVDAVANEPCRILFLDMRALLQTPAAPHDSGQADYETAGWRSKLTANLLQVAIHNLRGLSNRSIQTAPKTIRGRVLAYLNALSLQTGKDTFDIPFDRQQLADYLNVDRTALSKELGRMQKDGILRCRRSHFELLKKQ